MEEFSMGLGLLFCAAGTQVFSRFLLIYPYPEPARCITSKVPNK